jgi:8-oxo-dGTP diphosphatase
VTDAVQAAGGVVWRRSPEGGIEVLVVHRPRYDDWSLPKGKLDAGEDHAEAALREVWEETGLGCALGPELPSTSYRDRRERAKTVRYWALTAVDGSFSPTAEVDEARWLRLDDARDLLTYDRDRPVLDAVAGVVAG